jgi:hypothetical protein
LGASTLQNNGQQRDRPSKERVDGRHAAFWEL